jgi:hypothetical protein
MAFTDFPNGIQSANDYLSANNSVNAQLSGSVADIGRLTVSASFDFNLKEIICSLLAGRGLKLPNIQICISLNLKALLPGLFAAIDGIQDALYAALDSLDAAFDKFLDHLKFDEVLGRINSVLAEITQIASMINFCSAPLDPIQIPNVLENAMDSFLGAGRDIVDSIGTMLPDKIGGCLSIGGGFNTGVFNGGILGKISDNYDDIINGNLPDAFYDSIIADINTVVNQINDIIAKENGTSGVYDQGGSDLAETPRETNTGMGVLFNAQDEGIQGASRNGAGLWAAYQQLGSYQVTDSDGNVYNNIFELFCDDDLLRILRRTPNPSPEIAEQVPVYNYCGETIGYTKVVTQSSQDVSVGNIPGVIDQPGWNAGGLPTNPTTEAEAQGEAAGGGTSNTTVTNVYNLDGATLFVDSEAELLALDVEQGQPAYRTDNNTTYLNNGGTTGTISDWEIVGSGGTGGDTLGSFLTQVNDTTSNGFLVRSTDNPVYRSIGATLNQITVANGNGVAANPTISLASNLTLPGTDSVKLPSGATGDRTSTTAGALRFNTTSNAFEGYQGSYWTSFAAGLTGASNIGGGSYNVYAGNNAGTLEFKSINVSGAITITPAGNVLTISESLTAGNLGTGSQVFKQRSANNLEFRSITAGTGVTLVENANDIEISADSGTGTGFTGTTNTTDATASEVLFDGARQTPGADSLWFVTITAVAKRSDQNDATAIKIEGLVDNNAGTVTIVGTVGNKTVFNSTAATGNYDMLLDIVSNQFRVRIQGAAGHTVDWTVKYDFIESP